MWSGCRSGYVGLAWLIRCRNQGVAVSLIYRQCTPLNFLCACFVFTLLQSAPMLQPPIRYSLLVLAVLFLSGCTTPWVGGSLSRPH